MSDVNKLSNLAINDQFTLKLCLGRGGFGFVFQGVDEQAQKDIAIKLMNVRNRDKKREFENEVAVMKALGSLKNVVKIADAGVWEVAGMRYGFIAMELGACSMEKLKDQFPLSQRSVVSIGLQLFKGLEGIHSFGYLHRDIKLENLMIFPTQKCIKFCDYGCATKFMRNGRRCTPRRCAASLSSFANASPNMARGMPVSELDDGWMTVYCLLRLSKFPDWFFTPPPLRLQRKLDLAQTPKRILNTESRFLRGLVYEMEDQVAYEPLDFPMIKHALRYGIRETRSKSYSLSIKVTKTGMIQIK